MRSALPAPALQYLPRNMQDDPSSVALAAAIDRVSAQVTADVLGMRDLRVPESCPGPLLDELAASLGVNVLRTDGEAVKRAKITNGVQSQRDKSLWLEDVYVRIRNITGVDPAFYETNNESTWMMVGEPSTPETNYALFGTDGVDTLAGFDLEGSGTELSNRGSIAINIGTGQSSNIPRLVAELEYDVCPAYYAIMLGYISSGQFITYSGGLF